MTRRAEVTAAWGAPIGHPHPRRLHLPELSVVLHAGLRHPGRRDPARTARWSTPSRARATTPTRARRASAARRLASPTPPASRDAVARAASHDDRGHHRSCPARGVRLPGRAPRDARGGARAQPQPVRVRQDPRPAGPRADAHRARRLLGALVGALLLQALASRSSRRSRRPGPQVRAGPGRERRRAPAARTAGRWPSRSSRTTTRRRWSPTRAPRPAWAASCATSSPWARGRSRCSTACASARSTRRATATSSPASCGASATTATASASRRSAARSTSPRATPATRWSTRCASGSCARTELITARAHGVGNVLLVVGARTGRDGIHGASFASEELSEKSEATPPAGAGRRSLHREAAARGEPRADSRRLHRRHPGHGRRGPHQLVAPRWPRAAASACEIDTALVPTREPGMTPYEILLSESQERMLVVAEPGRVAEVQAVCAKWELGADADRPRHRRRRLPRDARRPHRRRDSRASAWSTTARSTTPRRARREAAIARRARDAAGASPAPSIEGDLRARCSTRPPSPASAGSTSSTTRRCRPRPSSARAATPAWSQVPGTSFGIAVTVDCNSRLRGARSLRGRQGHRRRGRAQHRLHRRASRSASPTASTSATRRSPRSSSSSARRCRGIADACRAFGTPVTGGNVSFYNENPDGRDRPDPDRRHGRPARVARPPRAAASSATWATRSSSSGAPTGALGGSALLGRARPASSAARRPRWTSTAERRLQQFLVAAAREKLLRSAHDCSEGGLAVDARGVRHRRAVRAGRDRCRRSTSRAYAGALDSAALLFGEDTAGSSSPARARSADRVVDAGRRARRSRDRRWARVGERHGPLAITAGGTAAGSGRWMTSAASFSTRFRGDCSTSRRMRRWRPDPCAV